MWVWLADHTLDEDGASQLTIFSGRGILSESQGPVWMIGTGERDRFQLEPPLKLIRFSVYDLTQTLEDSLTLQTTQRNITLFISTSYSMQKSIIWD